MKLFSSITLVAVAVLFFAFTSISYEMKSSTAEVEQVQGLYIFTNAKPVKDIVYLGTVEVSGRVKNPQYTNVRDALIELAKKNYPTGTALVLSLNAGGVDKADVIQFK